jgi:hypothetical protein
MSGNPAVDTQTVTGQYATVFDLDAEDQIDLNLLEAGAPGELKVLDAALAGTIYSRRQDDQLRSGLFYQPDHLYLSYEDDHPDGWYINLNVPTTSGPEHDHEVFTSPLTYAPGGTAAAAPWALEDNLGLQERPSKNFNPLETQWDDDVDALDLHAAGGPTGDEPIVIFPHRYWSPDSEGRIDPMAVGQDNAVPFYNARYPQTPITPGLDPGSIYLTTQGPGGAAPNAAKVFDQVSDLGLPLRWDPNNPAVLLDPDVDAFEFLAIGPALYTSIFELPPATPADILVALLSVDEDDGDTPLIDESGGLSPNVVFMSDLRGNLVPVSGVYAHDVDALAVIPEPATILLLGAGAGLAALRRRRRR